MSTKPEYWPLPITCQDKGYMMELRAALAWDLIHHFGAVAGEHAGEDSGHRAFIRLQTPTELVSRCYHIVDEFVTLTETRGELKSCNTTEEEAAAHAGRLNRLRSRAEYPLDETPGKRYEPSDEEKQLRRKHRHELMELWTKEEQQEDANKPK